MRNISSPPLIRIVKALAYGAIGAILMLLIVGIMLLNKKPPLEIWHTADLDEEFTSKSDVESFSEYLLLEDRLFSQLTEKVYRTDDPKQSDTTPHIERYISGSISDPNTWSERNWNRTFEMIPDAPVGAVLLLHGLSDSPYSLRSMGLELYDRSYHVLGLRIPGHGTAPSGLTKATWQDMAAAVKLAAKYLNQSAGDRPISAIGYSNGGALAVNYALEAIRDESLPQLSKLVLLSPEIGVTPAAAFAIWQQRIGRVSGLRNLAWTSILPEYDPFKYNSFAVNAGTLAHQLTVYNRELVVKLAQAGTLSGFPPTLTFQSAVDSTVSPRALVMDLYQHLPVDTHELVAYDINPIARVDHLLKTDPTADLQRLEQHPDRPFTFTVIGLENPSSRQVIATTYPPKNHSSENFPLKTTWPDSVYSLSHVALPFRADDPLYGQGAQKTPGKIQLGNLALRGEKSVLAITATDMLRLRWNPFYDYQMQRIIDHLK